MRRLLVSVGLAVMLVALGGALTVAAQEATPVSGFADLGLPELSITATASGYEGVPDQVEAGR